MPDLCAIILAAGLSRRMGAANKLLLPIGGVPMIRHVAGQYRAAISGPILVVTGHEADAIAAALVGLDVMCVFNPDYAAGQQMSVACGLRACPDAAAVLIGLGDQPLLTSEDIRTLIAAHDTGDGAGDGVGEGARISIPVDADRRGNPVLVPAALRPRLIENPDRPGCMRFTRDNPDLVQRHPLPAAGYYADIDTPDAYASYIAEMERAS